jgi:uncharacterized membrane protein YphA (DoxX/SURF4 family)
VGRQARERRVRREGAGAPVAPERAPLPDRVRDWLFAPQPIARLAAVRILVPLAILGFLSSRLVHADDWIGRAGFHVPDVGHDDYRQPLYLPALPNALAWAVAALTVLSGLALAAGALTRASSTVFAVLLVYLAVADRLAAFTVSKLGAALVVALAFTPAGARVSLDAWWRRRKDPSAPAPLLVSGGCVRFFQLVLAVMYTSSGLAKLRGDWLDRHDVIYTNLHDSYQTAVSYWLATHVPGWGWTAFQWLVLALEFGAPLWFALPFTRAPAVVLLLGMHAVIGLGFGPVIWFALLMASLLVAGFAPRAWLERALGLAPVGEPAAPAAVDAH